MSVKRAIRRADRLLPGTPRDAPKKRDRRWQAILDIGRHIAPEPEPIWEFIARWGGHEQEDLRDAVACCLLEHLLEYHYEAYFPRVEALAQQKALFGDMFCRCWKLGQSEAPGNSERFDRLRDALGYLPSRVEDTPEGRAEQARQVAKWEKAIEILGELEVVVKKIEEIASAGPGYEIPRDEIPEA